jgi:hypothetical protein
MLRRPHRRDAEGTEERGESLILPVLCGALRALRFRGDVTVHWMLE